MHVACRMPMARIMMMLRPCGTGQNTTTACCSVVTGPFGGPRSLGASRPIAEHSLSEDKYVPGPPLHYI